MDPVIQKVTDRIIARSQKKAVLFTCNVWKKPV